MKKMIASSLACLTFAGAIAASATPAEAASYRRHHRHHGGGDAAAAAIVAGVAGLAIGSALSSKSGRSSGSVYVREGYSRPYAYDRGYYYDDGDYYVRRRHYETCISRERAWDPYIERHVVIERRYAC